MAATPTHPTRLALGTELCSSLSSHPASLWGALQDVLVKVIRYEGFFSLWKGFTPYYARLGPHTVLTFIFLEQMNKYYRKFFLSA